MLLHVFGGTEKKWDSQYSEHEVLFLEIIEKLLDGFVKTEYELAGEINIQHS